MKVKIIILSTGEELLSRCVDKEDEVMYYKVFKPTDINGRWFSAIEYTTAIGMVSMVELFVEGKIPQKGYVRQEDVKWKDIVSTKYGSFYKE